MFMGIDVVPNILVPIPKHNKKPNSCLKIGNWRCFFVNKEIAEIKLHAHLWRSVQLEITSIYGINKVLCIKLIDFLMEKHKVLVDRKNEKIVEIKAFLSSL